MEFKREREKNNERSEMQPPTVSMAQVNREQTRSTKDARPIITVNTFALCLGGKIQLKNDNLTNST